MAIEIADLPIKWAIYNIYIYMYIYVYIYRYILVGGIPTPLKNLKVNGKDYPIYYGKIKNV